MKHVREQIAVFGKARNLVGIVTLPVSERDMPKPAVVILNSGVIHRVGHNRMYVTMARKLAAAGHMVLRFDLSGIGDSGSRGDSLSPTAAPLADISEALDWLCESHDVSEIILLGLCSGADIALRYGHTDHRVSGLALLDPTIPPTRRFYRHYIARRITSARSWMTFLRGRGRIWGDLTERLSLAFGAISSSVRLVDPLSRKQLERHFDCSIDGGLKLFVVFTGNPSDGRQAYKEQLIDAFPALSFGSSLTLEFFDGCDHVFTPSHHRERLDDLVLTWLKDAKFDRRKPTEPLVAAALHISRAPQR